MTPCPLCSEPVIVGTDDISAFRIGGLLTHRECALRSAMGGIGHLTDHEVWCCQRGDPDAGLSYRESSLAVSGFVDANGIEATIKRSVHHP